MSEVSTLSTDFNFLGTPEGIREPTPPPPPPCKLCVPQEIEYIAELMRNGGRCASAARTAGYTDSQARSASSWIKPLREESSKPQLWDVYQREMAESKANLAVTTDQILDEYSCIAFSDPINLFDDNNKPLSLAQMDHRTRRAISTIRYIHDEFGNVTGCEVKMIDKKGALDSLAKIKGMLSEKVEHTHTFTKMLDGLSAGNEPLVLANDEYKEVYEELDG